MLGAGGLGFALVPATIAAVQGISAEQSGSLRLLNTSRLSARSPAVLSTIADSHTSSLAHDLACALPALPARTRVAR